MLTGKRLFGIFKNATKIESNDLKTMELKEEENKCLFNRLKSILNYFS